MTLCCVGISGLRFRNGSNKKRANAEISCDALYAKEPRMAMNSQSVISLQNNAVSGGSVCV
jgi:hypothetical protein